MPSKGLVGIETPSDESNALSHAEATAVWALPGRPSDQPVKQLHLDLVTNGNLTAIVLKNDETVGVRH